MARGATTLNMKQWLLIAALMSCIAVVALDATIVSTALPTIVGNLGGLSLFSWVFSIYLLTSTVTVPLYGKLADLYGRKPVILVGCTTFLAGSMLCAIAGSMEQLIVFRAIQGLGAGAVQPITMTIVGDSFSIEQRARLQGVFSSVWGVTALSGPALGGLLTEGLNWRWVFLINLPICTAAIFLIWRFFDEKTEKREHVLDYWGTLLLSGSVVALLLGLLQGAERYGWLATETLSLFAVAAVLLAVFVVQELRTREPVLPMWLFKNRVIAVSCLAIFLSGGLMFGVSSYLPLFAQGVSGGTALDAGLIALPMSFTWPLGSILGGWLILRFGYYPAAVTGGVLLILGALTLLTLSQDAPHSLGYLASAIIGLGMGFQTSALIISVQNAVEWGHRGIATASTQFFRTIGGSISVAIMGAILNSQMAGRLADVPGVPAGAMADTLLNVDERANIAEPVLEAMQGALSASLHEIYFFILGAALISFAVILFFPRGQARELAVGAAAGEPEAVPAGEGRAVAPPERV
jgi:EmrB/QacA subfamily drug resistance transporter